MDMRDFSRESGNAKAKKSDQQQGFYLCRVLSLKLLIFNKALPCPVQILERCASLSHKGTLRNESKACAASSFFDALLWVYNPTTP